jgi:catechol-2,3-dioxygenase
LSLQLQEDDVSVYRLNHAVLYVRDVERSVAFYRDLLGFRTVMSFTGAAFLQAEGSSNDHDLGLFEIGPSAGPSGAGRTTVGLYHLAWEVETLDDLGVVADRLKSAGAFVGATDHGTTKAVYGRDPDGIEFEVSWLVPADRLDEATLAARSTLRALDIPAAKEQYGATTRGGVGVSAPA